MKARILVSYLISLALVLMFGGIAYSDINDGLIAHFDFENNINDSSPQQIQGVEYGNLIYESGVVGNYAARFDGNAAIYFPDSYLLNLCEGTISLFANVDCEAPYSQSILVHYRINYMTAMIYYPETRRLGTYLSVPVQPHNWVMVTYVYSNGCSPFGSRKVYLNGELYDTGTGYSNNGYLPPDYGYLSTIGQASSLPLDDPSYKYRGLIDDLRIYDRPLNDQEILELYQLATYPPPGPPCSPLCGGMEATIIGTDEDNIIMGTDEDDVIVGLGGNDIIYGLDGNDRICGGEGDDIIYGGKGQDKIWGEPGNDVLRGEGGRDRIYGGSGNDTLDGGGWHDLLSGGGANDTIYGANGDDELRGDGGIDVCDGGPHDIGDSADDTCEATVDIEF